MEWLRNLSSVTDRKQGGRWREREREKIDGDDKTFHYKVNILYRNQLLGKRQEVHCLC